MMNEQYQNFKTLLQKDYTFHEIYILYQELEIYFQKNKELLNHDFDSFITQSITELLQGKPYQQITKQAYFYGMNFIVNEHTLIPRPETEELIEWIIEENPLSEASILDIGTGSGIIPIVLKKKLPNTAITAFDISKETIAVANKNANLHHVEVVFGIVDFLSLPVGTLNQKWNIIVSNPPYIAEKEKHTMHKNVINFEPHTALFVPNENPLIFYEKMIEFSLHHLAKKGKIYVEINQNLAEETYQLFSHYFTDVMLKKDISGNNRMIKAEN